MSESFIWKPGWDKLSVKRTAPPHNRTTGIIATNTQLVAKLSAQLVQRYPRFSGSRIRFPAGGSRTAFFAAGSGWVEKYKILTLINFRYKFHISDINSIKYLKVATAMKGLKYDETKRTYAWIALETQESLSGRSITYGVAPYRRGTRVSDHCD